MLSESLIAACIRLHCAAEEMPLTDTQNKYFVPASN